jgi:DNA-binding PadR family transcriptional regulator
MPNSSEGPPTVPLTPLSHAVLLALADADRHGYGIIKEVERQTAGTLSPGTGTLYAALQRMQDETGRLARLVAVAREKRLVPDTAEG